MSYKHCLKLAMCIGTKVMCANCKLFGLCIHPMEWKHWSECLRVVTKISCLGTVKCIILNINLRRQEHLLAFFRQLVELPAKNQPFLDYFWDISRDWERLQRTTTLHGRLQLVWFNYIANKARNASLIVLIIINIIINILKIILVIIIILKNKKIMIKQNTN